MQESDGGWEIDRLLALVDVNLLDQSVLIFIINIITGWAS